MTDPFQDVDAAGPEFTSIFADTMDARQAHPDMERIVAAYLDALSFPPGSLTVEIGSGAGAVSRRIAARAAPEPVIGFDPSEGLTAEARKRGASYANLSFEVTSGAELPLDDGAAQNVIMHTVLSHVPDPALLLAEAARVLAPGGRLVVCDSDFSRATLGTSENDPLDACAREFVRTHVTHPRLFGVIRPQTEAAGFRIETFGLDTRLVTDAIGMSPWVVLTARAMAERGEIGEDLAGALVAEYARRAEAGTLCGAQFFFTLIAGKP